MSRAADTRPNAEREVALALGAVDPAQVAAHPLVTALAIDKAVSERLVSTYYDTADRALIADAIVLRVRRTPAGLVQTVKRGGPKGAGLAARDEWETALDDPAPQWPIELPGPVGAQLERAAARGPLAPVFVTDFTRSRRRLATPGGDVVELAIDIGVLRSGEHSRPIAEVELELKHGSAAGLFELALGLTETLPLTLQIVSKGERGYLLAAGAGPPAVVAERLKLRPGMSVGEAFDLVLPSAAGQAANNLPAIVEGSDPVEGVHQMRIGLRRLRAALSIFKSCLAKGDREMLRAILKPSLRALGPARDIDVFLTETMPAVLADFPDDPSVTAFLAQATATCDRVREDLAALLADPAHSRAWLTVGGWLAGRPVRSDRPVTQLAREVLDKRARKVRRAARAAEGGALEALHALRIEIKNLRYAGEFFASLYDARAAKRVLKALRAAQDHLGYLNDAAVSDAVLARVEADAPSSQARAVARGAGIAAGHLRARHADLHEEAQAAYEACAALKPFWR